MGLGPDWEAEPSASAPVCVASREESAMRERSPLFGRAMPADEGDRKGLAPTDRRTDGSFGASAPSGARHTRRRHRRLFGGGTASRARPAPRHPSSEGRSEAAWASVSHLFEARDGGPPESAPPLRRSHRSRYGVWSIRANRSTSGALRSDGGATVGLKGLFGAPYAQTAGPAALRPPSGGRPCASSGSSESRRVPELFGASGRPGPRRASWKDSKAQGSIERRPGGNAKAAATDSVVAQSPEVEGTEQAAAEGVATRRKHS